MNISVLEKGKCSGCTTCFNLCPVNAINMKKNDEGFNVPEVSENCVNCELCLKSCPQLSAQYNYKQTKEYFAAWAKSNERALGSSGGLFPLIAKQFIEEGSVVYGAAFTKDCMDVRFMRVDNMDELPRLFKSKYVQADVSNAYTLVKEDLSSGKKVLFSGCPCHVDGLYAYLGKNTTYKNLYTIDILCHGAPSSFGYRKFLEELSEGKTVVSVDFRDKTYGWGTLIKIQFSDGTHKFHPWNGEYFRTFLSGLSVNEACFECKYARKERVGDITLGDFWGVAKIDESLDDKKGTSIIAVNSEHGKRLLNHVKPRLERIKSIPISVAEPHQARANAAINRPIKRPVMRECFFNHLKKGDSFTKATQYAEKSLMDVGILGWWNETPASNYGSTLTSYALYKYLEDCGLSVAFVSPPDFDRKTAGKFCQDNQYRMTTKYSKDEMKNNNKYFDTFIVASDVLWYYDAFIQTGYMFMLDFVTDKKRKISYATSFGNYKNFFPDHELLNAKYYLNKFDSVSVRELEGVDICKDRFEVEATQVMDPVFLCELNNWNDLAEKAERKASGDYVFAYVLDPNSEKIDYIKEIAEVNNCSIYSITDKQRQRVQKEEMMEDCGVIKNATPYELLYHLKNAKYVVTDSYHGLCFSLIFNKAFSCLVNWERGSARFMTLAEILDIKHRFIFSKEEMHITNGISNEMDYSVVNLQMEEAVKESKKWLTNALNKNVERKNIPYEVILGKEIYDLKEQLENFQSQYGDEFMQKSE